MLWIRKVARRLSLDAFRDEVIEIEPSRLGGQVGDSGVNLRGGAEADPLRTVLPVATPNVKVEQNSGGRIQPHQDPPP